MSSVPPTFVSVFRVLAGIGAFFVVPGCSESTPPDEPVEPQLAFLTAPSDVGWQVAMSPAVRVVVLDQHGDTLGADTRDISLELVANPTGATLQGGETIAAVNGIATFSGVLLDKAGGEYTIRATAAGATSIVSSAFTVAPSAVVTSLPAVVGTGSFWRPVGVAIADGKVFVTSHTGSDLHGGARIWTVPVTGGEPSVLVDLTVLASQCELGYFGGGRILASGTQGSVTGACGSSGKSTRHIRFPLTGASHSSTAVSDAQFPRDHVFDGTYYYVSFGTHQTAGFTGIVRIRASDGQQLVLRKVAADWGKPGPSIAVGGGYVYYAGESDIERIPIDSGAVNTVSAGHNIGSGNWARMAFANDRVFWVTASGQLVSAPAAGGTATPHASVNAAAMHLTTDGAFLYLRDDNNLRRFNLTDFSSTTIVNDDIADIALYGNAVYWASSTSRAIKKAPK